MSWGHAHTLTAGLLAGLALDHHLIWVAAACLLAGFALGRCWAGVARLTAALAHRLSGHDEPQRTLELVRDPQDDPYWTPSGPSTHPAFDPWSRRV